MKTNLKPLIDKRAMTQTALAESLGITRSYMSLLVSGQRDPSPALLQRMADALGVTVADILDQVPPSGPRGFAESAVAPLAAPTADETRIAQAAQAQGRQVVLYRAKLDATGVGVLAGDLLAIDLQYRLQPGDVVIATETDADGNAETGLYRWADPWVMPANPAQTPRRIGTDGAVAILGLLVGVWRWRYGTA